MGFSVLPPPATCPIIPRQPLGTIFLEPDGSLILQGLIPSYDYQNHLTNMKNLLAQKLVKTIAYNCHSQII